MRTEDCHYRQCHVRLKVQRPPPCAANGLVVELSSSSLKEVAKSLNLPIGLLEANGLVLCTRGNGGGKVFAIGRELFEFVRAGHGVDEGKLGKGQETCILKGKKEDGMLKIPQGQRTILSECVIRNTKIDKGLEFLEVKGEVGRNECAMKGENRESRYHEDLKISDNSTSRGRGGLNTITAGLCVAVRDREGEWRVTDNGTLLFQRGTCQGSTWSE